MRSYTRNVSVSSNNITIKYLPRFEAAEEREKETRRKNIILYKIPESNAERNEDRNRQDVSFCLNVFNNCMQVEIAEEDFVNVFGLGKCPEPGVSTAVRPLMVQLASCNPVSYTHLTLPTNREV